MYTKNTPIRFPLLYISFFAIVVTLVWRGGEGVQGGAEGPSSLRGKK